MSSVELNEIVSKKKSKENEKVQPWVDDFTTGMACRPPRTIRWERVHKNSLNLSGSLPSLTRPDTDSHSSIQKTTLNSNTKSTQTPPLSELLTLSSSHSCRLDRTYCEEIRRREKYHYLSLAHLAATGGSGGGGGGGSSGGSGSATGVGGSNNNIYRSSTNARRSSLCLGGGVTDWHQMGKELRQIADDLHHRCCRSSTTSLDSTSSAESCLNAFSSKTTTTTTMTTSTSTSGSHGCNTTTHTNNLHRNVIAYMCSKDDDDYLLHRSQSLSAGSSFNDLRDRRNNKSK